MTPPLHAQTQLRNSQLWLSMLLILAIFVLSVATLASVAAIRNVQQPAQQNESQSAHQTIQINQPAQPDGIQPVVQYDKDDPLLARRMIMVVGTIDKFASETVTRHLITLNAAGANRPIDIVINSDRRGEIGRFRHHRSDEGYQSPSEYMGYR